MDSIPERVLRSEPGHAVFIVVDDYIPATLVRIQSDLFDVQGLSNAIKIVPAVSHFRQLDALASECHAAIADWTHGQSIKSMTVMIWCRFSSPLRVLPIKLSGLDAAFVRVFGPRPRRGDGCPDHHIAVPRTKPGWYYPPARWAEHDPAEYVPEPIHQPYDLAKDRLWKLIHKQMHLGLEATPQFDASPKSWLDLPLVNGFLPGQLDDDPRDWFPDDHS